MSVSIDVGSLSTVVLALKNLRVTAARARRESVLAAGPKALDRVKANVSGRKYSLADLARMDHPYARRHGGIDTAALGGRYQQKPYIVHTRSGDLRRGIRGSTVGDAYQIEATGLHARFVIGATTRSTMLRRDVLVDTFNEDGTRRVILREIARVLGQRLRTQATIRGTPRAKHPSATEV